MDFLDHDFPKALNRIHGGEKMTTGGAHRREIWSIKKQPGAWRGCF
jgi:hypothetical protein